MLHFCGTLTVTTENVHKMQVHSLQVEYTQIDLRSYSCNLLTIMAVAQ
jgi:hypothetical protein